MPDEALSAPSALILVELHELAAMQVQEVRPARRAGHEEHRGLAPERGARGRVHVNERCIEPRQGKGCAQPAGGRRANLAQRAPITMCRDVHPFEALEQSTVHISLDDRANATHRAERRANHQHRLAVRGVARTSFGWKPPGDHVLCIHTCRMTWGAFPDAFRMS